MTYPVKISESDRSPAGLFWTIAFVLTGAWVFFAYSDPSFAPTSALHTPLLSSLSILIIAMAVWRWSGRWWVLLLVFTSPFILWPLHTTILDTLPLLGLLIFTFFAPESEYAGEPEPSAERPAQRTIAEAASVLLLMVQPQAGGLAAVIIWLRSAKKWWIGSIGLAALTLSIYALWSGAIQPLGLVPDNNLLLSFQLWPWGLIIGVVLFWIGIGQRDVLISSAATVFMWPTLAIGGLTTFAVVFAARLPKLFLVFSLTAWMIFMFSSS